MSARAVYDAQRHLKNVHFKTIILAEVPQGRNGKHKSIVTTIIGNLDQLKAGSAIKLPLAELAESLGNFSELRQAQGRPRLTTVHLERRQTALRSMRASINLKWSLVEERSSRVA
jgi:hypothetical protein